MSDIDITYKGASIATMSASGTKTLLTSGKYCEDDIEIDYTRPEVGGDGTTWQDQDGYVHLSDEAGTSVTVDSLTITNGGTYTAPTGHAYSPVTVASGVVTAPSTISGTSATVSTGTNTLTLSKTVSVTPSVTTNGYVTSGTAGNSSVSLTASVNTRSSSDLTASGATVTAPSGYYASSATKTVASGTAGTPTATKGAVSNHSISVTPSVTNTSGYITGSTINGTAVTVSASELVSGTKSISANGTGIDVTEYASVDVAVPSSSPTLITKSITANGTYNASSDSADGYSSVTVNVSGGGGGGLVYESGTFVPVSDIAQPTINFTNTHTEYPFFALVVDMSEVVPTQNSMSTWNIHCWDTVFSASVKDDMSTYIARTQYLYKSSSNLVTGGYSIYIGGSGSYDITTYLSNSSFTPYSGNATRVYRAGTTYKWIAVWSPTT